jgi:hypothetical protein
MPCSAQRMVDPRRAVEAPVLLEHRLDLRSEPGVLGCPLSRRLLPLPPGIEPAPGHRQLPTQPGERVLSGKLIDQAKPLGGSCSFAKCAAASLKKSFSLRSSRFSLRSGLSSARSSLVSKPWSRGPGWPRSMRAWRTQRAKLLEGSPSRSATALQESPSCRQSSTASAICCAVNRRRVLVGLVIDGQSGDHGLTPIDLSSKPREPHWHPQRPGANGQPLWGTAPALCRTTRTGFRSAQRPGSPQPACR